MVKYQDAAGAGSHLRGAVGPDPAGDRSRSSARGESRLGQRAGEAVPGVAAGGHEAPRRADRRRTGRRAPRPVASSRANSRPRRWRKRCTGSIATCASGTGNSTVLPHSWRKTHVRQPSLKPSRQAQPHPQTSSQCGAGKSLRRVDEPERTSCAGSGRTPVPVTQRRDRRARRRPLHDRVQHRGRRAALTSAASTARSSRTGSSPSPGRGAPCRSASRS